MLQVSHPRKTGEWSESTLTVLRERYLAKDENGVSEAPEEMFWRVAMAIARAEEKWGKSEDDIQAFAETAYDLMIEGYFQPNSPTLMNAGKNNGLQYSACYVLPVGDSLEEIFEAVKRSALIHKSGGGCIAGDSRVWTTFCGIEPIEVLVNRATSDGRSGLRHGSGTAYDVQDLNIQTVAMNPVTGETGLRRVTHVWRFDVPAENQVTVRMREGTVVQTSDWHPFMVLRGDRLVETKAGDLASGDVVLGLDRPDGYWPHVETRSVGDLT
ncbi:MAG: hypothetical protein HYU64_03570, partial [Armatimonadetes bacterium]|nr:hypothetical protein [Armatimonadota bacterium]